MHLYWSDSRVVRDVRPERFVSWRFTSARASLVAWMRLSSLHALSQAQAEVMFATQGIS